MGNAIKYKRIFVGAGGDATLDPRITILENNEYKVAYFEPISSSAGSITKPINSTILLDQLAGGVDAYVSTIANGQPTGILPKTAGGVEVDVTSFDTLGAYTLSGTPSAYPVALIYILKIKAIDYSNLDITKILDLEVVPLGYRAGEIPQIGSDLGASLIIATNSSKQLVTLDTTTYPSLTELSYVKGVTSAIQTQLNTKEVTLTFSSGLTRTTNTITNNLITGISGGQTIIGGTAVGDGLIYQSTTANATPSASAHIFTGGNNGGTILLAIRNDGVSTLAGTLDISTSTTSPIFTASTRLTSPLITGGSGTTSSITYKTTSGVGASGADHIWVVGNNGATEAMRILNSGFVGVNKSVPTSPFHVGGTAGANGGITLELLANSGTAASSYTGIDFYLPGTSLSGQFFATASNYNGSNSLNANSIGLAAELTSGQLWLASIGSSGIIDLVTGGIATTNLRQRILSSGQVIFGGQTSLIGSEWISIQRNANSITQVIISNTTSGTAGRAVLSTLISGGVGVFFGANSAAFTTSGINIANTGVLNSTLTGGLVIGTSVSSAMFVYTNNTLRATFAAASGNVDFTGNLTTTLSTNGDLVSSVLNTSTAGTAARAIMRVHNNNYSSNWVQYGSGYTTAGLLVGDLTSVDSGSPVGILYVARGSVSAKHWWAMGGTAAANEYMRLTSVGLSIGTQADATAILTLKAGTTAASTAPLKFTAGTNMTAAEAGAMEFDGTFLYYTTSTPTRKTIATTDSIYWLTVPGTPVRVGNTSFTITDTANANLYNLLISRTTVLKWTDTGVTKMAMVVSATYAANAVTVTIIGDTLAASATMSTFKYTADKCKPTVFAFAGTVATGTNITAKYKAGCPMKVFGADALHGTAGTTNDTTYDINKAGTTMFTTKVAIASTATVGNGFTADSGTELALDDVVTVDCDSVSTTAPIDAYIYLFMVPLYNQYLN